MVGMRLLQHRRVDTRRHRKAISLPRQAISLLQPVTSLPRQVTSSHLRVGTRLRLHAVIRHLRVGILCRRVALPILPWT
jgi:hypothetical protein